MAYRAGDWVEVRSKREILLTLDAKGQLKGLPFMPEMFRYCGQRFKVYKRAHKTCDTVNGTGGRRLVDGLHLELRCDGNAHGGCQAACLIFWKEAWVKAIGQNAECVSTSSGEGGSVNVNPIEIASCTEEDVEKATRAAGLPQANETTYVCQATQLPAFTTRLRWWDIGQYLEDYTSGNVTLGQIFRSLLYASFYSFSRSRRRNWLWAPPLRWIYDRLQALRGGIPYPRKTGTLPPGRPAPVSNLNLQPGDLVRVKPYRDILATLTSTNKNRGLFFDAEQVPYCGGEYRVKSRLTNFIDEKTGRMQSLKTPAVILENVWCQSRYSTCRVFCPRSIYSWWREAWLENSIDNSRKTPQSGAKVLD
jgi:hypothetical protein